MLAQDYARPAAVYDATPRNLSIRWVAHDALDVPLAFVQKDFDSTYVLPLDVSDYQFEAFVTEAGTENVVLILDVDVTNPVGGELRVGADPVMMNITPGTYRWRLVAINQTTGDSNTWVAGSFEVERNG